MPTAAQILLDADILEDCELAELGDKRRNERLKAIMRAYSNDPNASNPKAMAAQDEQLAFYRFATNEHFGWDAVFQHHRDATRERCEQFKRVMIIHDTTACSWRLWDLEVTRTHLARPTSHTQGMSCHVAMAAVHDEQLGYRAAPMGFLHVQPFVQQKNLRKAASHDEQFEEDKAFWKGLGGFYDNESNRWFEGMAATSRLFDDHTKVIHLADREADIYELTHMVQELGDDYLIRLSKGRSRQVLLGSKRSHAESVGEALEKVDFGSQERMGTLGARPQYNARRSGAPRRTQRKAKLSVRWKKVRLRRPNRCLTGSAPNWLETTVVELCERQPPEGAKPVRWLLFTSLPIESEEEAWKVVETYQSRWLIEEGFDAWKNLCGVKKLQAQHTTSLLKMMMLRLPLAFELLAMRYLNNHAPDAPASVLFSKLELLILKKEAPKGLPENPKLKEAFAALARLGGHQPRHGPVGWKILARAKLALSEHVVGAYVVLEQFELSVSDL